MQTRFKEILVDQCIPSTQRRYIVDLGGQVVDRFERKIVPHETNANNEIIVRLVDGDSFVVKKVAVLIAEVWKDIRLPLQLRDRLDVDYVDGQPQNFHPSNTVWKYPSNGLYLPSNPEFCFIPGFSRYCIDKSGQVINAFTFRRLSSYQDAMGYWMYGVTPDVGKRTIVGMHRLLALAFHPYPPSVDSLDVNHLNRVKSDNRLDNLEWAERKRNCHHAYETGLRTDNLKVQVRNAFTGAVVEFYSLEECARQLKIDGETVRLRVRTSGQKIYPPGVQLKLSTDTTPWSTPADILSAMKQSGVAVPLQITNMKTGQTLFFSTAISLASYLNLKPSAIGYHVRKMGYETIVRGHVLSFPCFSSLTKSLLSEKTDKSFP